MQPGVTPFLWFDSQAEEAVKFYTSIFENSKIEDLSHYQEDTPGEAGSVMTVSFELNGQKFIALNGGPEYTFTPAVSFVISCDTQDEIDHYWSKLSEGGAEVQCGWLTDKYGLSWQVVPAILGDLLGDDDEEKSGRAMQAMLQMKKLDIQQLQDAFDGVPSAIS